MDGAGSSISFNVTRNLTNGSNSLWVDGYVVNPNPPGGKNVYIAGAIYTWSGFQATLALGNQLRFVDEPKVDDPSLRSATVR